MGNPVLIKACGREFVVVALALNEIERDCILVNTWIKTSLNLASDSVKVRIIPIQLQGSTPSAESIMITPISHLPFEFPSHRLSLARIAGRQLRDQWLTSSCNIALNIMGKTLPCTAIIKEPIFHDGNSSGNKDGIVKVTRDTKIDTQLPPPSSPDANSPSSPHFSAYPEVLQRLHNMISPTFTVKNAPSSCKQLQASSRSMILCGPSGIGKTRLVKIACAVARQDQGCQVFHLGYTDSGLHIQEHPQKLFSLDEIQKHAGTVVFVIDNCDAVVDNSRTYPAAADQLQRLLDSLDSYSPSTIPPRVCVIGCIQRNEISSQFLRSV